MNYPLIPIIGHPVAELALGRLDPYPTIMGLVLVDVAASHLGASSKPVPTRAYASILREWISTSLLLASNEKNQCRLLPAWKVEFSESQRVMEIDHNMLYNKELYL